MLDRDPERESREVDEWFSSLPKVPPEEIDSTDDLISRAMDRMTGKPRGSFARKINRKKVQESVPLTPELSQEVPGIDSPDRKQN